MRTSKARLVVWGCASAALCVLLARLTEARGYELVLALGVGACILFFAGAAPELSLYVLLAALPYSFRFIFARQTELQVPSEPIAAALLCAYLFDRLVLHAQGRKAEAHPLRLPLIAYALALALAASQSDRLLVSAKNAARSTAYIGLAFSFYALLRRPAVFRGAVAALTAGGAVAAGVMTVLLASRFELLAHSSAYRDALFTDYTGYGAYLTIFLLPLISFALFDADSRSRRPWRWGLLGLFGFSMLFCWSRGAWASLFAGVLFLMFQKSGISNRRKWLIACVGLSLAAAAALIPAAREAVVGRVLSIFDPSYASNRARLLRWGYALEMFWSQPVLGYGPGSFAQSYVNEAFLGYAGQFNLGAHNIYLQTLAETGLVGFAALAWLGAAFYRYAFRLANRLDDSYWRAWVLGLTAVQTSFWVSFLVGAPLSRDIVSVPFWGIFGALPAVEALANAAKNPPPPQK
ncbi:MAG: O-antigen ligase family protein [Candidatus Poribacteria bacterium]|nr:O-antigen ligase family protein [Candidatus Poribacteria bacterium]